MGQVNATISSGSGTSIIGRKGQVLTGGVVTPAALALCRAMRRPATRACSWDAIVDAAQDQTDPALWVANMVTNRTPTPPVGCRKAVMLETFRDGDATVYVFGCYARPDYPSVDADVIRRLGAALKRLDEKTPKTLQEQALIDELPVLVREFEDASR